MMTTLCIAIIIATKVQVPTKATNDEFGESFFRQMEGEPLDLLGGRPETGFLQSKKEKPDVNMFNRVLCIVRAPTNKNQQLFKQVGHNPGNHEEGKMQSTCIGSIGVLRIFTRV